MAAAGEELTPTSYISHHLTFFTQAGRRGLVLDPERRYSGDQLRAGHPRPRVLLVGGARRDCRRAQQAPGLRRARRRVRRRPGQRRLPRRPPQVPGPDCADRVRVGPADELHGLPAGGHHGVDLRARVPSAQLARRTHGGRQHHLRAVAVGAGAEHLLRHPRSRDWAAGSTSCSALRSGRTFCCGRPTSCSISSSTSPSRCRTRCVCSATCTRARSSSCSCGCGQPPA